MAYIMRGRKEGSLGSWAYAVLTAPWERLEAVCMPGSQKTEPFVFRP